MRRNNHKEGSLRYERCYTNEWNECDIEKVNQRKNRKIVDADILSVKNPSNNESTNIKAKKAFTDKSSSACPGSTR